MLEEPVTGQNSSVYSFCSLSHSTKQWRSEVSV